MTKYVEPHATGANAVTSAHRELSSMEGNIPSEEAIVKACVSEATGWPGSSGSGLGNDPIWTFARRA